MKRTRSVLTALLCILGVTLGAGCGDNPGGKEGSKAGAPPPPGHPAMAGGSPIPPGHPPVAGGEGAGALPPGHPPLEPRSGGRDPADNVGEGGPEVRIQSLVLTAPEGWVRRAPSSGFVAAEFALPRVEGDSEDGRLTISSAGGSVDANISRWQSQFKENPPAKPENHEVSGIKAVTVRLAGTLSGGGGPMAKAGADKPNWKMWGAVVPLPATNVFIKATGPQRTMERWEESFGKFLNSLKSPAGTSGK